MTPTAAYREWLVSPAGWLEEIIEFRTYAALKRTYEGLEHSKDTDRFRQSSDMAALVEIIEFELVQEAREQQANGPTPKD